MASLLRGVRVLLPEWTVALVRPSKELPSNVAVFRVDPKMNKIEIRDYLQSIYKVSVAKVHTHIQMGKIKKTSIRGVTHKRKDYKIAYVTLGGEQTFTFPELFKKAAETPSST